MFQPLVKLLTVTTFVAHGMLGCCWHHTHAHGTSAETAALAVPSALAGGCCRGHDHPVAHQATGERAGATDHHGGRDPGRHNSGEPRDLECDECDCVFVRTRDLVRPIAGIATALMPFLAPAFGQYVLGQAESDAHGTTALREAPLPAAIPRALWQVWLI
jgi:hypothetical protein